MGGVAAPLRVLRPQASLQFSPPLLCVPPTCQPGLPHGSRIGDLVLLGSGGGESGTEPLPPWVPGLRAALGQSGTEERGLSFI